MDAYLIRHAQAGGPQGGSRDLYRQLTDAGHERAAQLVNVLAEVEFTRILSSPATRCAQTVAPLGQARRLEVEDHPDLFEGTHPDHVLALLEQHVSDGLVVCSHGDVIPTVVETLGARQVPIAGRGCEKGSIWVLSHDGREWTGARHVNASALSLSG